MIMINECKPSGGENDLPRAPSFVEKIWGLGLGGLVGLFHCSLVLGREYQVWKREVEVKGKWKWIFHCATETEKIARRHCCLS
jgi:hypothetical protein